MHPSCTVTGVYLSGVVVQPSQALDCTAAVIPTIAEGRSEAILASTGRTLAIVPSPLAETLGEQDVRSTSAGFPSSRPCPHNKRC